MRSLCTSVVGTKENAIDGEALAALSTEDLKEPIKPLGVRVKLSALIKKERDYDLLLNESHVSIPEGEEPGGCSRYQEETTSSNSLD